MALKFGAAGYFSLMVMGLVAAAVLAHGVMLKSLAMVVLGLLLGIVGTDVNSGMARFSFGIAELTDGIGFVVLAMGVFGYRRNRRQPRSTRKSARSSLKSDQQSVAELALTSSSLRRPILRGTASARVLRRAARHRPPAIASFSSYMVEKKLAKDPSRFGKGAIEGVAGPEAANNAGAQTTFIPMLTLGIPASAVMALMLGAMTIQGIAPGPQVMTQRPDLFWGLIASMWIGNAHAAPAQPAADRIWVSCSRCLIACSSRRSWRFHGDRHLQHQQQPRSRSISWRCSASRLRLDEARNARPRRCSSASCWGR